MIAASPAIEAVDLRKSYRRYGSPLAPLVEMVTSKKRHSEFVAIDGVSLSLSRGEIVGIVGRNGAGKSTLLKLIAGTLEPTSGDLRVNGRITAILELGTGFHPDYTGRENIYMGGMCLGMSRSEIESKISSIIEFSELSDAIDQPFKTYSSGMQARLTFSTAISVEPEILIVDEALSVGDARFQMKCFSWIQRLKSKNATVLLVSHDTNSITTFCDRAVVLEKGKVFAEGDAKKMTVVYHNLLFDQDRALSSSSSGGATHQSGNAMRSAKLRYGTGEATLVEWALLDEAGHQTNLIESGAKCRFVMVVDSQCDVPDMSGGFAIKDRRGTVLWGATNVTHCGEAYDAKRGERLCFEVACTMWLAPGDYFVTLGVAHVRDGNKIDFVEDGIDFKVFGGAQTFTTSIVNLDSSFSVEVSTAGDKE